MTTDEKDRHVLAAAVASGAQAVYEAVERQAAVLRRPPMTIDELLDRLAVTVPDFACAIRRHRRHL